MWSARRNCAQCPLLQVLPMPGSSGSATTRSSCRRHLAPQAQARLREAGRAGRGTAARGQGCGRGRQAQLAHLVQLLRMAPAAPTGIALPAASVDAAGHIENWLALRARIKAARDTHRAAAWRAVQQAIVQEGVAVLAAALAEPAAPEPGMKARLRLCLRRGYDVCASDIISSSCLVR